MLGEASLKRAHDSFTENQQSGAILESFSGARRHPRSAVGIPSLFWLLPVEACWVSSRTPATNSHDTETFGCAISTCVKRQNQTSAKPHFRGPREACEPGIWFHLAVSFPTQWTARCLMQHGTSAFGTYANHLSYGTWLAVLCYTGLELGKLKAGG